ncbi:MAG TPA: cytochrome D1 domain-containing protein [Rhizomicrobium sp.]|nr:cytochrome D1 domain-containing protein [Rhizomicrobium sp.]
MIRKLVLGALCAVAMTGNAQAATRSLLYVANSQGDDISIIDLATQKVIKTLKVGPIVHGVCAQADGRRAFATIESENSLKVIDTKTNTVTDSIALGGRPNECAATNDGRYVVVPLLAPANLSVVVDVAEKKIVKSFKTVHPHNCFTPEGGSNTIVYCEERDAYRIHRIDLAKMEITNEVKVAGDPRPFAITKDEKTLYTALSGLHGVAVIDIPHETMSQIALPPMPWMACKVEPPNTPVHGVGLTPDGKKLWITSVSDAGIYVYDIASKKLGKKITVGGCPNWISFSADGKYAGVSNADTDDTSILDVKAEKEIARVKVGTAPKRVLVIEVPQDQLTEK